MSLSISNGKKILQRQRSMPRRLARGRLAVAVAERREAALSGAAYLGVSSATVEIDRCKTLCPSSISTYGTYDRQRLSSRE